MLLIIMPTCQKMRCIGITKEDQELILTLMAIEARVKFEYNKEELKELIRGVYQSDKDLLSTLTPERLFTLLKHKYDICFAANKASAQ